MTVNDVRKYCGGKWINIGRFFGFSPNAYQGWIREGEIPISTQIKIERMTHGQLVARVELREDEEGAAKEHKENEG